jgi:hypothetical protein
MKTTYLIIMTLFLCPSVRSDELLKGLLDTPTPSNGAPFIYPNENNTSAHLKSLRLERAAPGLIISTGFERSFILGSHHEKATGMIILDYNRHIIHASEMNISALKNSPKGDIEYYKKLRTSSNEKFVTPYLDKNDLDFFDYVVHRDVSEVIFSSSDLFNLTPYWDNPDLLSNIQDLARQERIKAFQIDLFDFKKIEDIVKRLSAKGEKLSILDLSNILSWVHKSDEERMILFLSKLLETLAPISQPGTILSGTLPHYNGDSRNIGDMWKYYSYTFAELKNNPSKLEGLLLELNFSSRMQNQMTYRDSYFAHDKLLNQDIEKSCGQILAPILKSK